MFTGLFAEEATGVVSTWGQKFVDSFHQAFGKFIENTPYVVAALAVLVGGYIVARVLGRAGVALGEAVGLDKAAERSGLSESMKRVGIRRGMSAILGQVFFWLSMCFVLIFASDISGMTEVKATLQRVADYIPSLLVAALVVVIGLLVASFLRGVIASSADRIGLTYAEHLANACYYVLALMVFVAAFKQLNIEFALLEQVVLIGFGAIGLGVAIALGLGGKEVVGGILAGYYTRQRLHAGDHVHVGAMEGIVREVGPVATVIETHEQGMVNRHSIPNVKMLSEAVR